MANHKMITRSKAKKANLKIEIPEKPPPPPPKDDDDDDDVDEHGNIKGLIDYSYDVTPKKSNVI